MKANTESPATLGAIFALSGVEFTVWAPKCKSVAVKDVATGEVFDLMQTERGYFENMLYGMMPQRRYMLVLDGELERPDPASRFQPEGVHGPSEVFDTAAFMWKDKRWRGIELKDYVIYQVHVGTLTPGGTFSEAAKKLAHIKEMGFTAIEIMPFAEFPGVRGWGYDCVCPFAPHHAYGGPLALKNFVEDAHKLGLAVIMNMAFPRHGMEGNYLEDFGPYYTDRYVLERGKALNFDGPHSDEVRRFFVENALYWVNDYHMDAIRISGVESIFDFTSDHILGQVAQAIHTYALASNRAVYVFGEGDTNDVRITGPREMGGLGLDAQVNPDFHQSLFAFATGRKRGVYADFGEGSQVAESLRGFVYRGQYSKVRHRSHGSDSASVPPVCFIASIENAVDVGRRPRGDRLNKLLAPGQEKVLAGLVLLCPQIPLVFQGDEYAEKRPFLYFSDFADEELIRLEQEAAVARAARFGLTGQAANPQAPETFARCKLDSKAPQKHGHLQILRVYKKLVELRKELKLAGCEPSEVEVRFFDKLKCLFLLYHLEQRVAPAGETTGGSHPPARYATGKMDSTPKDNAARVAPCSKATARNATREMDATPKDKAALGAQALGREVFVAYNIGNSEVVLAEELPEGSWQCIFDSEADQYGGLGLIFPEELTEAAQTRVMSVPPWAFAVYTREKTGS